MSSLARYGAMTRWAHGFWALAIPANLALGWLASDLFLVKGIGLLALHAMLGLSVLAALSARTVGRLFQPAPAYDPKPAWLRAIKLVHGLLLVLSLTMALSGLVMLGRSGGLAVLLGLTTWPAQPAAIPALIHGLLAPVLALLVAGHSAAALAHGITGQRWLLTRMWPPWHLEG